MGRWLRRIIMCLTNHLKYKPLGGNYEADYSVGRYYENASEFWEDFNNAPNGQYSYKWCLKWVKSHPNSNIWDDLIMKDPYLRICCEKRKSHHMIS